MQTSNTSSSSCMLYVQYFSDVHVYRSRCALSNAQYLLNFSHSDYFHELGEKRITD